MLCCSHFRELVVCKAVSLDIASMEERFFFHSLRYTLINLLKAATPVSSSLTHLKRQTALNPTRIFSMDASARKKKEKKSVQPCNWQLSVTGFKNEEKGKASTQLVISPDGCWAERQLQGGYEAPSNRVVAFDCLHASSAHQTTAASFPNRSRSLLLVWSLSISLGGALHPVFTMRQVTFIFCPLLSLSALAAVSQSALGQ